MFYAKSTGGFYSRDIHGANIPADAVEITREEYSSLLAAQSSGKVIQADQNGNPIAVDPPKATAAQVWERIKVERDRRRFDGGVKVDNYWFVSNSNATGEYNTLALLSSGLPDSTVLRADWRTMDGAKVDMTPALVRQILSAGFSTVAAIDDAAQSHKAAMGACSDPSAYDFSADWPPVFGE